MSYGQKGKCCVRSAPQCIYDRLLVFNLIHLNQNFFIWIVMVSLDRRPVSSVSSPFCHHCSHLSSIQVLFFLTLKFAIHIPRKFAYRPIHRGVKLRTVSQSTLKFKIQWEPSTFDSICSSCMLVSVCCKL